MARVEQRPRSSISARVWERKPLPASFVGWVERSETHQPASGGCDDGFRFALPIILRLFQLLPTRPRISQCEIVVTVRADDIVSNSTLFPNPFLSVYWHTKPGADPCTNKGGSEAIGVGGFARPDQAIWLACGGR